MTENVFLAYLRLIFTLKKTNPGTWQSSHSSPAVGGADCTVCSRLTYGSKPSLQGQKKEEKGKQSEKEIHEFTFLFTIIKLCVHFMFKWVKIHIYYISISLWKDNFVHLDP